MWQFMSVLFLILFFNFKRAQNVYNWDFIHRYFPQEQIEKYRQQIIYDWKSDLFNNEEIWGKYGMSENTFYDLIKRYAIENENGLKDK
jgi:hypothetical protein